MKPVKALLSTLFVMLVLVFTASSVKADYGPCDFGSSDPWHAGIEKIDLECGLKIEVAFYYRMAEGVYRDIFFGDYKILNSSGGAATPQEIADCLEYYKAKNGGVQLTLNELIDEITKTFMVEFFSVDGDFWNVDNKSEAENRLGDEFGIPREYGCDVVFRFGSSACYKASWSIYPYDLLNFDGWEFTPFWNPLEEEGWSSPLLAPGDDEVLDIQRWWIWACNSGACCLEYWQVCVEPNPDPMEREHPIIEWTLVKSVLSNNYDECDRNNLTNDHCQPKCE